MPISDPKNSERGERGSFTLPPSLPRHPRGLVEVVFAASSKRNRRLRFNRASLTVHRRTRAYYAVVRKTGGLFVLCSRHLTTTHAQILVTVPICVEGISLRVTSSLAFMETVSEVLKSFSEPDDTSMLSET